MGTRSITRVQENGKTLLAVYRQYDGYLSGHGNDLAEFLADRTVVNGIRIGTERQVFNGPGCLAAQLVAFLKKDEYNKAGSIYIVPADSDSEEYDYNINVITKGEDWLLEYEPLPIITVFNYDEKYFERAEKHAQNNFMLNDLVQNAKDWFATVRLQCHEKEKLRVAMELKGWL